LPERVQYQIARRSVALDIVRGHTFAQGRQKPRQQAVGGRRVAGNESERHGRSIACVAAEKQFIGAGIQTSEVRAKRLNSASAW
jgi:hypothetical protein